ncbi:MAG TPA: CAP domain-containing protein [Solirubrobacteraceae bacterium]|nr:CAP domain-containing protein [Solirubrobacteraceae bacterium]
MSNRSWLTRAGLLTLLAAICVAVPTASASAAGCRFANTPVFRASRPELRRAVVCLINQQRISRGLPRLHANGKLNRSAQRWTRTMVRRQIFTHGTRFWTRISAVGFDWSTAGENIAVGFATPSQVVKGWMASLGHCENILDPAFSQVGTGELNSGIGGWGGPATWTQDFALRMGRRAPSHNMGPYNGCPYNV